MQFSRVKIKTIVILALNERDGLVIFAQLTVEENIVLNVPMLGIAEFSVRPKTSVAASSQSRRPCS